MKRVVIYILQILYFVFDFGYIDIQVLKGFEERHNMINSVCVTLGIAGSNS
jgi:hypothetical protein